VNKTRKNKTGVRLTCAVVSGVEMTDELLGVVGVVGVAEVVKGVDEDVGADDKVEGARRESSYCAFGVNRGTYTAGPGR
jgi:hypothetical protein